VYQLVPDDRTAWHAGISAWKDLRNLNNVSLGIEIQNHGPPEPFPDVQVAVVVKLVQELVQKHGIPRDRVVGHSDIAPRRKQDPGYCFPWVALARAGLGVGAAFLTRTQGQDLHVLAQQCTAAQVEHTEAEVLELQRGLRRIGYAECPETGRLDPDTLRHFKMFQWHFTPTCWDAEGRPTPEMKFAVAEILKEL
jgi:N-acetyl-anhydromuramyl-L-alanine amidase AmpD